MREYWYVPGVRRGSLLVPTLQTDPSPGDAAGISGGQECPPRTLYCWNGEIEAIETEAGARSIFQGELPGAGVLGHDR